MSPDDEVDDDGKIVWRRPSRSQQKRDADRVAALALRLMQLKPAEFAALGLHPAVAEAVAVGRELTKNARSRQLRRIAKLLRATDTDTEGLVERLDHSKKHVSDSALAEQEHEHWRSRLLSEGDAALQELLASVTGADIAEARRDLRQLMRSANKEPLDTTSRRARLLLLRKIRELCTQTPADAVDEE
jgi:ribosome-associated protein